eukprot:2037886-Pleurochrysis_carterae.AAC.1
MAIIDTCRREAREGERPPPGRGLGGRRRIRVQILPGAAGGPLATVVCVVGQPGTRLSGGGRAYGIRGGLRPEPL